MARYFSRCLVLLQFLVAAFALPRLGSQSNETVDVHARAVPFTSSTSSCSGYTLANVTNTKVGLTAHLTLAGDPCMAFGTDITELTLEVTYDTQTRLHVKIYDTARDQFQIPESLIARAGPDDDAASDNSHLVFNYNEQPFEFWISRRDDPADAIPLFDTRKASLPATPIGPVIPDDASTALPAFNLVFEDQYLELTTALPLGANIYGLGEAVASSGFRRDIGVRGGRGTVQSFWSIDNPDSFDQNLYGSHPFYLEQRYSSVSGKGQSHGFFLRSSEGADVLMLTPQTSASSLIQFRLLGGVWDSYFFSGPDPKAVVEQYGALIGLPMWQPTWAFGFHLCRFGYQDLDDVMSQGSRMRDANIPLEVQWVDIDVYDRFRDFTTSPDKFPADRMSAWVDDLHSGNQRFIPIVDPGIPITDPSDGHEYKPYDQGVALDVFHKMENGSYFHGKVWPGDVVFPDWFNANVEQWWTENMQDWFNSGVKFDGIWLDMNGTYASLAANSCDGICGVVYSPDSSMKKREDGDMTGRKKNGRFNFPPYSIHNAKGKLVQSAIDTFTLHAPGYWEYDVHNLFGLGEEIVTNKALQKIHQGERPFIISRSTFPSSGKWTGHWLGDNWSQYASMWANIQGVLQFQMYQIPMVGADTCGFLADTTEELCNRWTMMSAFTPFYRNHNVAGAADQEPYRWDSVAEAARTAIAARYALLPYWSTLFAYSSLHGTPPMRALFWEFPDEPELYGVDTQFMVGASLLITPALAEGATSVNGILPGRGNTVWRDWWMHEVVSGAGNITFDAPLGAINVHVRGGSALLLHASPAYTTAETRAGPYSLLVVLDATGAASGSAYIDDGISNPPGPSTVLAISASGGNVTVSAAGEFAIEQKLTQVTLLGVQEPQSVALNGAAIAADKLQYDGDLEKLVVTHDGIDLNEAFTLVWA